MWATVYQLAATPVRLQGSILREETFSKFNVNLINIFDQMTDYLILLLLADIKS